MSTPIICATRFESLAELIAYQEQQPGKIKAQIAKRAKTLEQAEAWLTMYDNSTVSVIDATKRSPERRRDIVLPLSSASCDENAELRYALRSIERHAINAGTVYIVSDAAPAWLQNCVILPYPDRDGYNKDANLIDKMLHAARTIPRLGGDWVFWSDDQTLLRPLDLAELQVSYLRRSREAMAGGVWGQRVLHTQDVAAKRIGRAVEYGFESHIPQPVNGAELTRIFEGVDYHAAPGLTLNTYYNAVRGSKYEREMDDYSAFCRGALTDADRAALAARTWCGYTDDAFRGGLKTYFEQIFKGKSRYEK